MAQTHAGNWMHWINLSTFTAKVKASGIHTKHAQTQLAAFCVLTFTRICILHKLNFGIKMLLMMMIHTFWMRMHSKSIKHAVPIISVRCIDRSPPCGMLHLFRNITVCDTYSIRLFVSPYLHTERDAGMFMKRAYGGTFYYRHRRLHIYFNGVFALLSLHNAHNVNAEQIVSGK